MRGSTLHRYSRWGRYGALLGWLVVAAGMAQVQLPEEKEDPKGGVKRKVVVEDDLPPVRRPTTSDHPPDVKLDELERAAASASPEHKALLQRYLVPSDRLTTSSGVLRTKPVPIHRSEWKNAAQINVIVLDSAGQPQNPQVVKVKEVQNLEYFEGLVLADAGKLTSGPSPSLDDWLTAEQLLSAALRFHDYARERNLRRGKGWDELRGRLWQELRRVRLAALQAAQARNDFTRVRELSRRLSESYPQDEEVGEALAAVRLGEAERLLQSPQHLDHVRAREILDDYVSRFPGRGGERVQKLRAQLREMARQALQRAKEKKEVGDLATARDELGRAAGLAPSLEGLRELQRELRFGYSVLAVGVWQLPRYCSPSLALLDSEKQAVELLFEGLLEEVRDSQGSADYRAAAARTLPLLLPAGREFSLRTYEQDPVNHRPGFNSHDVAGTVQLLRRQPHTWSAYPLLWLATDPPQPRDAAAIRIYFAHLHPDPRALLTFKLLPARFLLEQGKLADDLDFGQRPFGTGPFRLHSRPPAVPGQPRELVFVDNPAYSLSRDRAHLPHIREIRFIELPAPDYRTFAVEAFRNDKLHLLPDIPTVDLERFWGPGSGLADRVQVATVTQHRRIHILAINLERPYLQRKPLRQALSLAIDREAILDDVFRGNQAQYRRFHKVLTGPFPAHSWAAGSKPGSLTNRDLAVQRLQEYLSEPGVTTTLILSYPQEDPRAALACTQIKTQIETLFEKRLTLQLEPVSTRELLVRVHEEHRYDLAYIPFDYPDDWYPYALAALLDRNAVMRNGRNCFSFRKPETRPDAEDLRLGQLLDDLRQLRDYDTLVRRTADIVERFNQSLPFIPLWQLDRHIAIHRQLRICFEPDAPVDPAVALHPTLLFTRVAYWRLD